MAHLNVVATIVAKDGREEEVGKLLLGLVGPSRLDPGCLSYDLHRAIDDPRVFVFYETWESRELLDAHMQTPHLLDMLEKLPPMASSVDLKLLEKLG